jgi:hypothetical protein
MTLSTARLEVASFLSRRFAHRILFVVVLYELKEKPEGTVHSADRRRCMKTVLWLSVTYELATCMKCVHDNHLLSESGAMRLIER